jgi:UDP-N-acetylglucosamine 1-carboxyvinyltransferase
MSPARKESFIVKGLSGKRTLRGSVQIQGAKNAALKAMAAAVLFDGKVILENVPNTDDIHTLALILRKLGAEVNWSKEQAPPSRSLR